MKKFGKADSDDESESDSDDDVAPTYFGKAVDNFNLDSIFIDEECYRK